VSKHIFEQVIGNEGLLKNKARLLVTHALHVLPQADQVVFLKEGKIAEVGTYEELKQREGDAFELFGEHVNASDVNNEQTAAPPSGSDADAPAANEEEQQGSHLIAEEYITEGSVNSDMYLQYFRAMTWEAVAGLFAICVLSYMANAGINKWLDVWSSEQAAHDAAMADGEPNPPSVRSLGVYLGVYAGLGCGNCLGVLFATLMLAHGSIRASKILHEKMLLRIVRSPMSFFDTTPMGRIIK
jgi:ABC-type multidrug transport system fused ATPase/permease subunit